MKTLSLPSLHEIAKSAAVTDVVARGLTREQHATQDELRARFDLGSRNVAHGVVLPWVGEPRDMTATGLTSVTGDQGGMTVGSGVPEIGAALRANLVLEKLGGHVIGGLRSDVSLPRGAVTLSAEWLSETAAASDTTETLAALNLSPKRVSASLPVSDQLLLQGSGIEAFLRAELMDALAVEIQRVAIAGTGASNQPTGIINTASIGAVAGGANGAAPTYANLCDLEYAVTGTAKAGRGHLGWLVSPHGRRKLRQTFVNGSGSAPVWSAAEAAALLGHAAGVTPSVPDTLTKGSSASVCSAIIFGEFSELFVVFFGPGIVVNAVRDRTFALAGKTLLYATAYCDTGVRHPAAFAAMQDALCAV